MTTELKNCPFCNGDASVSQNDDLTKWGAYCLDCSAEILDEPTEEEAIAAWNKRTESEPSKAGELPTLPEPEDVDNVRFAYTADQMREYALAALASAPPSAQTVAQERPTEQDAYQIGAKGAPATDDERKLFEAWMRGHCWALSATWNGKEYRSDAEQGGYLCPHAMLTRQLWAAWRDRAALAAPAQLSEQTIAGTAVLHGSLRTDEHGKKIVEFDAAQLMEFARALLSAAQGKESE